MGGQPRAWPFGIAQRKAELDTVVGQPCVDLVGHGGDQLGEEGRRRHAIGFGDQLDEGKLAGPVDANEEKQFALGRLHLGDIDVK